MENNDYLFVRTGYNTAISDVLEIIEKNDNLEVIKHKIKRKQRLFGTDNTVFEGTIYKYYHKESNIGYVIYDSICDFYGVMILIDDGYYKEIDERELVFVKNNFPIIWSETFNNKDLMNLRYKDLLNKFTAI